MTGNNQVTIGHGLDPETREVLSYSTLIEGQKVIFLDTPGFDDYSSSTSRTTLSDVGVMHLIGEFLIQNFSKNTLLQGKQ